MTDARFPERYLSDRRVLRLAPEQFRGWVMATIWCVSNRTDGVILDEDLPLIIFLDQDIADALTESGLWIRNPDGWEIEGFTNEQTSRHDLEVLENARRREREKKARQRAKQVEDIPEGSPGGRVPGDSTGQARTGQDHQERFARAYEHWPKKKDRKRAFDKFTAAAKRRDPAELAADVIRFGDAYKATTEPKFVPALDVWLSGDRWEDDLPTASSQAPGRSDPDAWMQVSPSRKAITPDQLRAQRDASIASAQAAWEREVG